MSSSHTTQGTVAPPGVSEPAATRGFSASLPATLFSEQASSAACDSAQGPKPCVAPEVSSTCLSPAVPLPTACQWKPPSAAASETIFAAKTCWLVRSPERPVGPSSYQTAQATVSFAPVNAMSGASPSRVGSMFRVGSPDADGLGDDGSSRRSPTCCQQNPFTLLPPAGVKPVQAAPVIGCFTAFETKILECAASSVAAPSFSFQTTQGTGSFPATVAPPATEGSSAVRSVWMLRDGMRLPPARSCPEGSHTLAPALKRLAKMFVGEPKASFGSYHATQGTVRPVPAKSIDGDSASLLGSMLSDAGNPWVTQAPFLKARTKISCALPTFCSNVAHGTSSFPAVTAPPVTSETPASWPGSIELAGSAFTCEPSAGRGASAPCAGQRRASRAAARAMSVLCASFMGSTPLMAVEPHPPGLPVVMHASERRRAHERYARGRVADAGRGPATPSVFGQAAGDCMTLRVP